MFSHPDSSDKWGFTSTGSQMGSLNHRQLHANEEPLIRFGLYCFLVFCFFVSVCCTFLMSEMLKGFFYIFAYFFRTVTSSPPLPFSCIVSIGVLWEPWLGETKGEARARKTRRPPNRSQILCLQNGLPVTVSALAVGWGMDKQTSELLLQTNQMINNLGFVDNGISGINLNSAFLIVIHP